MVALQTMISKSELKRSKVKMPLKGSKMPYNRFYTPLRVEIPPKSKTPLKTPLNAPLWRLPYFKMEEAAEAALCGVLQTKRKPPLLCPTRERVVAAGFGTAAAAFIT